jgi:hypothetical protein
MQAEVALNPEAWFEITNISLECSKDFFCYECAFESACRYRYIHIAKTQTSIAEAGVSAGKSQGSREPHSHNLRCHAIDHLIHALHANTPLDVAVKLNVCRYLDCTHGHLNESAIMTPQFPRNTAGLRS